MGVLKVFLVFLIFVGVQSSPIEKNKSSDLIIGKLNPGDKFLSSIWLEDHPSPHINLTSALVGLGNEFIKISYVTVIEYGNYPDAKAILIEGGPGFSFVKVELILGPSKGFNYTTSVYGTELKMSPKYKRELSKSVFKNYV